PLEPVALELRPGVIYTVYLGRDLGLSLEQREDARALREMLLKAPKNEPETQPETQTPGKIGMN
ncbi:MAG: hypothetical protein WCI73_09490, partial [Phycisphaerae bacterium]